MFNKILGKIKIFKINLILTHCAPVLKLHLLLWYLTSTTNSNFNIVKRHSKAKSAKVQMKNLSFLLLNHYLYNIAVLYLRESIIISNSYLCFSIGGKEDTETRSIYFCSFRPLDIILNSVPWPASSLGTPDFYLFQPW